MQTSCFQEPKFLLLPRELEDLQQRNEHEILFPAWCFYLVNGFAVFREDLESALKEVFPSGHRAEKRFVLRDLPQEDQMTQLEALASKFGCKLEKTIRSTTEYQADRRLLKRRHRPW